MSEMEHFRARMRLPIGTTSFGIALTPEMIENNARIEKEINQRIKDGYYKNWGYNKTNLDGILSLNQRNLAFIFIKSNSHILLVSINII